MRAKSICYRRFLYNSLGHGHSVSFLGNPLILILIAVIIAIVLSYSGIGFPIGNIFTEKSTTLIKSVSIRPETTGLFSRHTGRYILSLKINNKNNMLKNATIVFEHSQRSSIYNEKIKKKIEKYDLVVRDIFYLPSVSPYETEIIVDGFRIYPSRDRSIDITKELLRISLLAGDGTRLDERVIELK